MLRKQLNAIFQDGIGLWSHDQYGTVKANTYWRNLCRIMAREHESFYDLEESNPEDLTPMGLCAHYLLKHTNTNECLSLIELACCLLEEISPERPINRNAKFNSKQSIEEVNVRFREHAIGYEFSNRQIVRIDSQFTHAEIVKPALALLSQPGFEKANEDFLTAHKLYRNKENKDAIVAANRAFESTLKAICNKQGWTFNSADRATELIARVRENGLFPAYLDNGLNTFIAMLRTGLPSIRNNAGGHGDAPDAPDVSSRFARYAIDLAAANIVFLVEAMKPPAPKT